MVVISQSEFSDKYLELSSRERVIIAQKDAGDLIELVRKNDTSDLYLTADEFISSVHEKIDQFPEKQ